MNFGIKDRRTKTIAEVIDALIQGLKEDGKQNAATYDPYSQRVISVFDNNKDKQKDVPFEQYEKMISQVSNMSIRRQIDGKYDWWIVIYPPCDPITGMIRVMQAVDDSPT